MANRLEIAADVVINGANQLPAVADGLERVNNAGGKVGDTLGGKTLPNGKPTVAGGAGNAAAAMINLNRVVQDAPFGLLGIANNIDPLLQSLTALGNQAAPAGATGLQRFKAAGSALLSVMMGPQGILFAISAITSAMLFFRKDISNFFSDVDTQSEETEKILTGMARSVVREFETMSTAITTAKKDLNLIGAGDIAESQDKLERINKVLQGLAEQQAQLSAGRFALPGATTTAEFMQREQARAAIDEQIRKNAVLIEQLNQQRQQVLDQIDARIRLNTLLGEEAGLPKKAAEKKANDKTQRDIDEEYFKQVEENERNRLRLFNNLDKADADREEKLIKDAEKTAKEKLKWDKWYAEQRELIAEETFNAQVNAAFSTAQAIQAVNEAFLGGNKEIAVAAVLIEKSAAIAQVLADGITKSAAATAAASLAAANPATLPLAASYARAALMIKASTAAAVVAIGAQTAAQIAQIYGVGTGGNNATGTGGAGGVTVQAGYTGFSATTSTAARQEQAGTRPMSPVMPKQQTLRIVDGFGNMVARGQLEISQNPNLTPELL